MFRLKEYLKDEIEGTKKLIKKINEMNYPKFEGTMICQYRNGKYSYYMKTYNDEHKREHKLIGNEKNDEVLKRKEKCYIELMKKKLEKNLVILENVYPKISSYDPDTIVSEMPLPYQDLEIPAKLDELDNNGSIELSEEPCPYKFNDICSTTITGQKVRSKGEALIFNLLYAHGVKFHYEKGIKLKAYNGATEVKYPDFIIELKNGKYLFWEHLGIISDYDYCINFAKKLHIYQHNNILLGVNLITTSDSENSCTFTHEADTIIRNIILPICKMR